MTGFYEKKNNGGKKPGEIVLSLYAQAWPTTLLLAAKMTIQQVERTNKRRQEIFGQVKPQRGKRGKSIANLEMRLFVSPLVYVHGEWKGKRAGRN